jgi:short-subunit dehydrogenase
MEESRPMTDKEGMGRTALVTGASAGIGTALARVFAENGFGLVLTARREERLRALSEELSRELGVPVDVIPADLADPAAPARLFEETERRGLRIDALVNNAGYGVPNYFRNKPWSVHAEFLQVMVTAVVHLTHLYEPGMTERRYGRIINVSSLAALAPGSAGHTLYAAAKSFLVKFSESLTLEHRGDGVHATALCPGFTFSEFHDVVGNRALVRKLPSYLWMDAEPVARGAYAAVMAGDAVFVPGFVNRAIASAMKMLPETIALGLVARQTRRYRVGD